MKSPKRTLTKAERIITEDRAAAAPIIVAPAAQPWAETGGQRNSRLASLLEVPLMHKRLICVCLLVSVLLGWVAILVWPRSYESETRLLMRVGRESVSLDPTATTSETLVLRKTQEEEIISALEVLTSRQVAESVVDKLGADAILNGVLPDDASGEESEPAEGRLAHYLEVASYLTEQASESLSRFLLSAGIKDDIGNRELAIRQIQSSVEIFSPRKSTVICIAATAKTPAMAQAIANAITESFVDEHLEGSRTEGSFEFFQAQSTDIEQQLNDLVANRAKFMQEQRVVSIDANRELLRDQLSGIDRDLAVAQGKLEQAAAEVEDLRTKVLGADDEIVAEKMQAGDDTWSGMRQQVYALELEEQKLAANFSEKHPRLKRIRTQLVGAREILKELDSDRVDENTTPNPIKLGLREELQRKQTLVVGLQSMIKEQQEQRRVLEQQAKEFLDHERELTQIDRDIALKTASLTMLREKLEQARVNEALHSDKFSNIHVFQPATFVERAASPKKKILGLGFVMLGLMTGLGLSFLREASSPTLRTADDVEFRLGAPVISTIPRIKNMTSPRLKYKSTYRKKCQELMAQILMTQHRPGQTRGRSLGVIGVDVGAGASTLAVNLALASDVDCHLKTVLVDADSRTRSVSKMFGLNGSPGLVELLSGAASHDECLQKVQSVDTHIDLIASSADSCDEMLANSPSEIVQALEAYLHDCDLLIVDLPAASQPDQAVALAQHLDCLVVVAESEKTLTASTERLLNRLSQSNTEILGVVLTKTRNYLPRVVQRFVGPRA